MAEQVVTPIRPTKAFDLTKATDEQQIRVWRLRSLIQCVREAPDDLVHDPGAAMDGLLDLADSIHSALDKDELARRAEEIAEEEVRS